MISSLEDVRDEAHLGLLGTDLNEGPNPGLIHGLDLLDVLDGARHLPREEIADLIGVGRIGLRGHVGEDRDLRGVDVDGGELDEERLRRRRDDLRVEGVAHGDPLGVQARRRELLEGPLRGLGLAAGHGLGMTVLVGAHDVAVQTLKLRLDALRGGAHGQHPAVVIVHGAHVGHGGSASRDGLQGALKGHDPSGDTRAVLAEAVTDDHIGPVAQGAEDGQDRRVHGQHGRLRDLGSRQLLEGVLLRRVIGERSRMHEAGEGTLDVTLHDPVRLGEHLGGLGEALHQIATHAQVLRSLAREEEGEPSGPRGRLIGEVDPLVGEDLHPLALLQGGARLLQELREGLYARRGLERDGEADRPRHHARRGPVRGHGVEAVRGQGAHQSVERGPELGRALGAQGQQPVESIPGRALILRGGSRGGGLRGLRSRRRGRRRWRGRRDDVTALQRGALDHVARQILKRRVVREPEVRVLLQGVDLANLGHDLGLLHRVDTQIGLQLELRLDLVRFVARALTQHLHHRSIGDLLAHARRDGRRRWCGCRRSDGRRGLRRSRSPCAALQRGALDHVARQILKRRVVREPEVRVLLQGVDLANLGHDLGLLHRVDTQIGLQLELRLDLVRFVARALTQHLHHRPIGDLLAHAGPGSRSRRRGRRVGRGRRGRGGHWLWSDGAGRHRDRGRGLGGLGVHRVDLAARGSPGALFLEDDVDIGASKPEGADASAASHALGHGPLAPLKLKPDVSVLERELGIRVRDAERGRQRLVVKCHGGLHQRGRARGRLQVSDVALDRANRGAVSGASHDVDQAPDLDGIAHRGARPVSLEVGHRLGVDLGVLIGPPNRAALSLRVGGRDALATSIRAGSDATDDRVDLATLGLGVRPTHDHEHSAALTHHEAVGRRVERARPLVGERSDLRELHVGLGTHARVHAADHHRVMGSRTQALYRDIERGQARGAGRVHRPVGAAQIEGARHAARDAVRKLTSHGVFRDRSLARQVAALEALADLLGGRGVHALLLEGVREDLVDDREFGPEGRLQPKVTALAGPDHHGAGLTREALVKPAGVLEGLPGGL